ncbi:LOW QUALITY PROTEIN: uncharacterized protein [Procambarus clarkii]|uniref:LOW QUALITY PROTEIN: uncharacterized protein n=1 Tax=Procambarus clarkii TaxID=6728 RepID=UPI003742E6B8
MTEQDVGGVGGHEVMASWETRAEELFTLCDRERKGIVTKRDLKHLWGEVSLEPEELERAFQVLDHHHNGYLTLQEFTLGFGCHLGLVEGFRAELTSKVCSEVEQEAEGGAEDQGDAFATSQLDTLLKSLADHDLDSYSAGVEAAWREVCGGGVQDAKMEQFVAALLQELLRVKADHALLEAALATKTDQYNQQVAQLYEELESQLSGEQTRAADMQSHKAAQALVLLQEEVAEREKVLRTMEEELRAVHQQLEQMAATEAVVRLDNSHLSQHVDRLEEELARKVAEGLELTTALEAFKTDTKNEKIRRAQQAFKVSEAVVRERESLVTQLGLLRTINTQLRDEHDQATHRHLRLSYGSAGSTDCEHDEEYFKLNLGVQPGQKSEMSQLTTAVETNLLQELLQYPPLCTVCGGKLPNNVGDTPDLKDFRSPIIVKQDSTTQTSLTGLTSSSVATHTFDKAAWQDSSAKILEQDASPTHKLLIQQLCGEDCGNLPSHEVHENYFSTSTDNFPRHCLCNRFGNQFPIVPKYSTTIIVYQLGHHDTTQVLPLYHTQYTHHTFPIHHTYHTFNPQSWDTQEKATTQTEVCTENGYCIQTFKAASQDNAKSPRFRAVMYMVVPLLILWISVCRQMVVTIGTSACKQVGPVGTIGTSVCRQVVVTIGTSACRQVVVTIGTSVCRQVVVTIGTSVCRQVVTIGTSACRQVVTTIGTSACRQVVVDHRDQCVQTGGGDHRDQCVQTGGGGHRDQCVQTGGGDHRDQCVQTGGGDHRDQCVQIGGGDHRDQCMQEDIFCGPVNNPTQKDEPEGDRNESSIDEGICKMGPDGPPQKKLHEILDTVEGRTIKSNFQNDPTIMVTSLPRHYPCGDSESKVNDESAEVKNKEGDQPLASTTCLGGKPLLYCPSRMFKVVFIGDSGVGKTSFIHRASMGVFRGDFGATVGVDYQTLEVQVGGVLAVLQLWDTAGQERFRSITRQYYRKVDGVVVMYDLTSEQSFLNVVDWITSVKEMAGEVVTVMLGNKGDLQESRCISQDMADNLAKANCCLACECSAATGSGVQDVMTRIATLLTTKQVHKTPTTTTVALQEPFRKGICCKCITRR